MIVQHPLKEEIKNYHRLVQVANQIIVYCRYDE